MISDLGRGTVLYIKSGIGKGVLFISFSSLF